MRIVRFVAAGRWREPTAGAPPTKATSAANNDSERAGAFFTARPEMHPPLFQPSSRRRSPTIRNRQRGLPQRAGRRTGRHPRSRRIITPHWNPIPLTVRSAQAPPVNTMTIARHPEAEEFQAIGLVTVATAMSRGYPASEPCDCSVNELDRIRGVAIRHVPPQNRSRIACGYRPHRPARTHRRSTAILLDPNFSLPSLTYLRGLKSKPGSSAAHTAQSSTDLSDCVITHIRCRTWPGDGFRRSAALPMCVFGLSLLTAFSISTFNHQSLSIPASSPRWGRARRASRLLLVLLPRPFEPVDLFDGVNVARTRRRPRLVRLPFITCWA